MKYYQKQINSYSIVNIHLFSLDNSNNYEIERHKSE